MQPFVLPRSTSPDLPGCARKGARGDESGGSHNNVMEENLWSHRTPKQQIHPSLLPKSSLRRKPHRSPYSRLLLLLLLPQPPLPPLLPLALRHPRRATTATTAAAQLKSA